MSRGMTLVEVLAALVLLSMLAGASAGMLGDALRQLEDREPVMNLAEVDQVVEQILNNPSSFGSPTNQDEWQQVSRITTELGLIHVWSTDTEDGRHRRIVFTLDTVEVVRWLPILEDES